MKTDLDLFPLLLLFLPPIPTPALALREETKPAESFGFFSTCFFSPLSLVS